MNGRQRDRERERETESVRALFSPQKNKKSQREGILRLHNISVPPPFLKIPRCTSFAVLDVQVVANFAGDAVLC